MLDFAADVHRFLWYRFFGAERQFWEPRFVFARAKRLHASAVQWPAVGCMDAGIWAFYPSQVVPPLPACEGRDLLREALELARREGLHLVAHVNVSGHPAPAELLERPPEAQPPPGPCLSDGDLLENRVKPLLREIATRYDIDAVFFEGPSRRPGACRCDLCREGYRAMFGADMPPLEGAGPDGLARLIQFSEATSSRVFADVAAFVHGLKEGLPIYRSGVALAPTWRGGLSIQADADAADAVCAQSFLYDSGPARRPPWHMGCVSKYLRSVGRGKPVITQAAYSHKPWDSSALPADQLRLGLADTLANGALPLLCLEDLCARDERGLPAVSELFGFIETNRAWLAGARSLAPVALVWSRNTSDFCGWGGDDPASAAAALGGDHPHVAEFRGLYDCLMLSRLPFDVIGDVNLTESCLRQYATVALPHVAAMSDEAVRSVRSFVQRGGGLIATGETSFYGERGLIRPLPGLADLLGIAEVQGALPCAGRDYMRMNQPHPVCSKVKPGDLVPRPALSRAVKPLDKARVLCRLLGDLPSRFAPGREETPWPGILVNEPGGRVVYFPGLIGAQYWTARLYDHRDFILGAVDWLTDAPIARVDGPRNLEITIFGKPGAYVIHLVNFASRQGAPLEDIVPARQVKVTLRCPQHVLSARSLTLRSELSFQELGGATEILVPEVQVFEVIAVKVESGDS